MRRLTHVAHELSSVSQTSRASWLQHGDIIAGTHERAQMLLACRREVWERRSGSGSKQMKPSNHLTQSRSFVEFPYHPPSRILPSFACGLAQPREFYPAGALLAAPFVGSLAAGIHPSTKSIFVVV